VIKVSFDEYSFGMNSYYFLILDQDDDDDESNEEEEQLTEFKSVKKAKGTTAD
jgi:hypothetical protein